VGEAPVPQSVQQSPVFPRKKYVNDKFSEIMIQYI
jgi:hypothetical protein